MICVKSDSHGNQKWNRSVFPFLESMISRFPKPRVRYDFTFGFHEIHFLTEKWVSRYSQEGFWRSVGGMVFRKMHLDTLFQMQKCVEMQILSSEESGKVISTHLLNKKSVSFYYFWWFRAPPDFPKPQLFPRENNGFWEKVILWKSEVES